MLDDALPVAVDLADADLAADVVAHVESVLGWQVVDPTPHLPARLALADRVDPALPTVVVAARGTEPPPAPGALAVLTWPDQADRLAGLVPPAVVRRPARLVTAGAGTAPRVGTSTVALAIGAHHAWAGRTAVVVTDAAGRRLAGVPGPGRHPVAGVEGLSIADDVIHAAVGEAADVVVVDRGAGGRARVVVGRPDADLVRAAADLDRTTTVITTGTGGLHRGELARLLDGRHHIPLPDSFRVARAGLRGRVPVGLPGRYLAALAPLVGGGS
ncbi:hypothetical protein [Euzebya sp.]|uniref:hypothetical protein n=1 Tax=Euzebya sp. TaxID=1971409 RepID=UPI003514E38F